MPTFLIRRIIFGAAIALAAGCSSGNTEEEGPLTVVKGKLVDNGKPFALDESKVPLPPGATARPPGVSASALQVTLFAAEGGKSYTATTNANAGTFEVTGSDGKGIPNGRYKITVTGSLGMGSGMPDYFKGKFAEGKTKILRDVKPGEEITIDVSKPEG